MGPDLSRESIVFAVFISVLLVGGFSLNRAASRYFEERGHPTLAKLFGIQAAAAVVVAPIFLIYWLLGVLP